MASASDHQRTIVIGLTVLFVLLIVGVSLLSLGDDEPNNESANVQATTIPFGPLGNGVATCEKTSDGSFVVLYSIEESSPKTFLFEVELESADGSKRSVVTQAENVTSARSAALVVATADESAALNACRITGIQQDKRILVANS